MSVKTLVREKLVRDNDDRYKLIRYKMIVNLLLITPMDWTRNKSNIRMNPISARYTAQYLESGPGLV